MRRFAALPRLFAQQQQQRFYASSSKWPDLDLYRNIGISAHIDSGKTTLTERVLYYTGRIAAIHEVKGKDGVGATMDSMDLEREKGITIQSASTYTRWANHHINIIDTPGHVDFTIEVERALRVLDGAVLVLCGVGGVQSQTMTVDRQMNRYRVPRIAFVNKLDRAGANPFKVIGQLNSKLNAGAAAVQMPMGLEHGHHGVVDLVLQKALFFEGENGEKVEAKEIPEKYAEEAAMRREELIEAVAEVDDVLAEKWIEGEALSTEEIKAAIRRATVARRFTPVFMGSAFKNKGVQPLLDGVIDYLPAPPEVRNVGMDLSDESHPEVVLHSDPTKPTVAFAFKLEEGRFGQLTYMRIYQGALKRGDTVKNNMTGEMIRVQRLVRMHADSMEEMQEVGPGEIAAVFGVDCHSGTTFSDPKLAVSCTSIHVPDPVISLAIATKAKTVSPQFSKALTRFQKEDPTFRVHQDEESNEIIISGMGELHLEIYAERIRREYGVDVVTGRPQVAFRETLKNAVAFDHLLKKQTGGQGMFARVIGKLEPMDLEEAKSHEFVNDVVGATIPPNFMPACEKGFEDSIRKGPLTGNMVKGVRMVVSDGEYHAVDSSEMAFRRATSEAFRKAFMDPAAGATIMEPIMRAEVNIPSEYQGPVIQNLTKRKGMVLGTETEGDWVKVEAEVPLNEMFGYIAELRSMTQGKGDFSMEYFTHRYVTPDVQAKLIQKHQEEREAEKAAKK